jgi:hypothetical protein
MGLDDQPSREPLDPTRPSSSRQTRPGIRRSNRMTAALSTAGGEFHGVRLVIAAGSKQDRDVIIYNNIN